MAFGNCHFPFVLSSVDVYLNESGHASLTTDTLPEDVTTHVIGYKRSSAYHRTRGSGLAVFPLVGGHFQGPSSGKGGSTNA